MLGGSSDDAVTQVYDAFIGPADRRRTKLNYVYSSWPRVYRVALGRRTELLPPYLPRSTTVDFVGNDYRGGAFTRSQPEKC